MYSTSLSSINKLNIYEQIILEDIDIKGISNLKEFDIRLKYIKSYSPSLFIKFLRAWVKVLTALSGTALLVGSGALILGIVKALINDNNTNIGGIKFTAGDFMLGGLLTLFTGLLTFVVKKFSKEWMINTIINELTELVYSGRMQTIEDQQELEKLIDDLKILAAKESGENALTISHCIQGLASGAMRGMIRAMIK